MNLIVNKLLFGLLLGAFVVSCQSNPEKKKAESAGSEPLLNKVSNDIPAQTAGKEHPGKAVYTKYCLVCHQTDGSGVPGMYPPLTSGAWVGKDPKELIGILTKGLSGVVEVNNEVYKSAMPAQAQLSDQEVADVLSFIRSGFGNSFEAVGVELVKKTRSGTSKN